MKNLELYNKVRKVPDEAKKEIKGGRLNGFTDISPQWRIKTLTEQFGACGIGWYYEIINKWLDKGAGDIVTAHVEINLYIKIDDQWSKPIPGLGGSSFVSRESKGLYTSDECYKMALTDALSVSCKALGVGADVYFSKDKSKYDDEKLPETEEQLLESLIVNCRNFMDAHEDYRNKIFAHFAVLDYDELTPDKWKTISNNLKRQGVKL